MNYYSMCHEVVDGGYTDGEVLFFQCLKITIKSGGFCLYQVCP